MHEASIAMNVLDTVLAECRQRGFQRIEAVRLRIGRASGILPDALRFAFDIAKADTAADQAELHIELVPLGGHCRDCGHDFETPERVVFECPHCHGNDFSVARGYEMDIVDMEVN